MTPTGIEWQPAADNKAVKSHKLIHRFGRTEPAGSDGHHDVLVNNADMSPLYEDIRDVSQELWDKVVGVILFIPNFEGYSCFKRGEHLSHKQPAGAGRRIKMENKNFPSALQLGTQNKEFEQ